MSLTRIDKLVKRGVDDELDGRKKDGYVRTRKDSTNGGAKFKRFHGVIPTQKRRKWISIQCILNIAKMHENKFFVVTSWLLCNTENGLRQGQILICLSTPLNINKCHVGKIFF